jgi:hypothetical protein
MTYPHALVALARLLNVALLPRYQKSILFSQPSALSQKREFCYRQQDALHPKRN